MSISPVNNAMPTPTVASVGGTAAVQSPSSVPPPVAGATADISGPGKFFAKLQQLSQSDPAKFKDVASKLADEFKTAASNASGQDAQFLSKLADRFTKAAQTGQFESPDASRAGGAHHHHHHHGSEAAGGASSSIQKAFQDAIGIVDQAVGGTDSPSATSA